MADPLMTTIPAIARVPCDSLAFFPGNPRTHDIAMIAESLGENGQYRPLVVQASTRYVLAGNGTLEAALSLGWAEIDAVLVDVDDLRARKIVLTDNKTADAAGYSADDLAALLVSLDSDLAGTGYTADDLARLTAPLPEGFQPLDPDAETEPKLVTCPACGHEFTP
jgi:ParB-like chromosome segregation protein Spo0J